MTSDWPTAESVAAVIAEGDGYWQACSGCQESVDGCVSSRDYPYSAIFQCHPGMGCRECGGIGVVWVPALTEADVRDMAEAASAPSPSEARALREALECCKAALEAEHDDEVAADMFGGEPDPARAQTINRSDCIEMANVALLETAARTKATPERSQ